MSENTNRLLRNWLQRKAAAPGLEWLDGQLRELRESFSERTLHITLGLIPRRLGKQDLALEKDDLDEAAAARIGWDPQLWSVDVAARVLVLCEAGGAGARFAELFADICQTADVGESIAYYCGLPLYPAPEMLENQAAEGLRTNMRGAFEAIAHRNPFPKEQFDENRWNQMVLKALFIGSTLAPVQGLDDRANHTLARILCDFAHERWAAGRAAPPELWRCVGPFAAGDALDDLERVVTTGDAAERMSASLALSANPAEGAKELLARHGEFAAAIASGEANWNTLPDGA